MSRKYHPHSIAILKALAGEDRPAVFAELKSQLKLKLSPKDFYNYLFRLTEAGLVVKDAHAVSITAQGNKLLQRLQPERDGMWKLVIFDIPEKHKYVRSVLRAKLKQLHFKKWQNSIWASPYALDKEIEAELDELGKKFFVRLIKTADINNVEDLEKMFV